MGAQAVGPGEGVKRIDVLATAMTFGATVDDLPAIDLGYAPPYATAIDIAAHAANVLRNKIEGIAQTLTPMEVKAMVDRGEDFVWLDVRSPDEFKQKRIEDPRVKLIPLGNAPAPSGGTAQRQKNHPLLQNQPAGIRSPDPPHGRRVQGRAIHGRGNRSLAV